MKLTKIIVIVSLILTPYLALAADKDPAGMGLPLVFEEDFSDGADRWNMTDPKAWDLKKDGDRDVLSLSRKSEYQPPVRSPHSIAWVNHLDVKSFVLEVNVKQTGREYGHRDSCLFFGRKGADQFYYVHIASVADPHAHSIFRVNKAPRVSISAERTDGFKWTDGFHKVRIVRDGETGSIDVYVDDMEDPIMHTVDKTFVGGTIGLGSFDDQGHFDTVRVWGK